MKIFISFLLTICLMAWSSSFTSKEGDKMKIIDYLADNTLRSTAEYTGQHGSSIMIATLNSIDAETYKQLKAQILKGQ